jgi:hypothetical protein
MSATLDGACHADFGKALIEQAADELKRRLAQQGGAPDPEVCSLMLTIHYAFEIAFERFGPSGAACMLEAALAFAEQAVTGEVAG